MYRVNEKKNVILFEAFWFKPRLPYLWVKSNYCTDKEADTGTGTPVLHSN